MDDERFLSFEEPIKELAQKLSALRTAAVDSPALNEEILNLFDRVLMFQRQLFKLLFKIKFFPEYLFHYYV